MKEQLGGISIAETENTGVVSTKEYNPAKDTPQYGGVASIISSRVGLGGSDPVSTYDRPGITQRIVDIIVDSCAMVNYTVKPIDEFSTNVSTLTYAVQISRMLNIRPNENDSKMKLFKKSFLDFMLYGNAYFLFENNDIHVLEASRVSLEEDPKKKNGQRGILFVVDGNKKYTNRQVIHIKESTTRNEAYGRSRLWATSKLISLSVAMTDFQYNFFKNNAVPGTVLQTDNPMTQKNKELLLKKWTDAYSALTNGSKATAILDNGLKIHDFSKVNFDELDFEASVERIDQDIAKILGVPYVLLKAGNNANISPNESIFYKNTIMPIVELYASSFAHFFMSDVLIRPNRGEIDVLQPELRDKAHYVSTLVNGGIYTPNEGRRWLGEDPITDDPSDLDKIRVPQNIAGSATNPSEGGRPPGEDNGDESNE